MTQILSMDDRLNERPQREILNPWDPIRDDGHAM